MFNENIKFKYTWRPYQAKVLQDVNKFLDDKRVNIVAAPGSGKTVLLNACTSIITYENDEWKIESYNDVTHLQVDVK